MIWSLITAIAEGTIVAIKYFFKIETQQVKDLHDMLDETREEITELRKTEQDLKQEVVDLKNIAEELKQNC